MKRQIVVLLVALMLTGCAALQDVWDMIPIPGVDPKPDPEEVVDELPPGITWADIEFNGASDCSAWKITAKIKNANRGHVTSWQNDGEQPVWASKQLGSAKCTGTLWLITPKDGKYYAIATEWLKHGQTVQANKIYKSDRGNKRVWSSPLKDWEIPYDNDCWLFKTRLHWHGLEMGPDERSNVVEVKK